MTETEFNSDHYVIVTRHKGLAEYIVEKGIAPKGTRIVPRVTVPDFLDDKIVVGVLPLRRAARAELIVDIPLLLEEQDRNEDLSVDRIREIALPPRFYRVTEIKENANGVRADGPAPVQK